MGHQNFQKFGTSGQKASQVMQPEHIFYALYLVCGSFCLQSIKEALFLYRRSCGRIIRAREMWHVLSLAPLVGWSAIFTRLMRRVGAHIYLRCMQSNTLIFAERGPGRRCLFTLGDRGVRPVTSCMCTARMSRAPLVGWFPGCRALLRRADLIPTTTVILLIMQLNKSECRWTISTSS